MITKAITAVQVVCLLAVIVSGLVFVLTGTQPDRFVSLVWVMVGAGVVYFPLEAINRWVV